MRTLLVTRKKEAKSKFKTTSCTLCSWNPLPDYRPRSYDLLLVSSLKLILNSFSFKVLRMVKQKCSRPFLASIIAQSYTSSARNFLHPAPRG